MVCLGFLMFLDTLTLSLRPIASPTHFISSVSMLFGFFCPQNRNRRAKRPILQNVQALKQDVPNLPARFAVARMSRNASQSNVIGTANRPIWVIGRLWGSPEQAALLSLLLNRLVVGEAAWGCQPAEGRPFFELPLDQKNAWPTRIWSFTSRKQITKGLYQWLQSSDSSTDLLSAKPSYHRYIFEQISKNVVWWFIMNTKWQVSTAAHGTPNCN